MELFVQSTLKIAVPLSENVEASQAGCLDRGQHFGFGEVALAMNVDQALLTRRLETCFVDRAG